MGEDILRSPDVLRGLSSTEEDSPGRMDNRVASILSHPKTHTQTTNAEAVSDRCGSIHTGNDKMREQEQQGVLLQLLPSNLVPWIVVCVC